MIIEVTNQSGRTATVTKISNGWLAKWPIGLFGDILKGTDVCSTQAEAVARAASSRS